MTATESIRCACRAVRAELFHFSFHYPLGLVPDAGPKNSLAYYFYSDTLAWRDMRMGPDGVPLYWCRELGAAHWPAYIAWYGLVHLGHYLQERDPRHRDTFLTQAQWLEDNALVRPDGAVVWPMNFDHFTSSVPLKAPWVSAHAQGFAISAMVRAWRLTRRPRLLELLYGAARIFELTAPENDIRLPVGDHVVYAEIPGGPAPGILDGFLISLFGLYDLAAETGDPDVARLFAEGVAGLKATLGLWDYRNKWSWYDDRQYLSPPAYHCQHQLYLRILGRLTGEALFSQVAARWDPARLSALDRAEIYCAFICTKNWSRLRHRTWRHASKSA